MKKNKIVTSITKQTIKKHVSNQIIFKIIDIKD